MNEKQENQLFLYESKYEPLPLRTENMCYAYGRYWFTSFYYNALFSMERTDLKARFVCSFPNEQSKPRMYSKVISDGKKIYTVPLSADSIGVYDVVEQIAYSIPIELPKKKGVVDYDKDNKFFDACADAKFLYLFPYRYPAILKMSFNDNVVEYFYDTLSEVVVPVRNKSFYFTKMANSNEGIILFSNVSKTIFKLDLDKMLFEKIIDMNIDGMVVVAGIGNEIWMYSGNHNCIYMYIMGESRIKKITIDDVKFVPGSIPITRAIEYHGYVYFFPGTANYALKVNLKTHVVSIADEIIPQKTSFPDREVWKFGFVEVLRRELFTYDATSQELLIYNSEHMKTERCAILPKIDDVQTRKLSEEYSVGKMKNEKRIKDLRSLVRYIK